MNPIRYFSVYERRDALPGRLEEVRPGGVWRALAWLAGRRGWRLARRVAVAGPALREWQVDGLDLLTLVQQQLLWARSCGLAPTKVVIGQPQYERLLAEPTLDARFFQVEIPPGVPLLAGLELIYNPMIDGVVVA